MRSTGNCILYNKLYGICNIMFCHFEIADYSKGFGGKYGVQEDRKDKVSVLLMNLNTTKQC